MKCFCGISNFLKEISSLSHSIFFLYFFPLITEEVFLISLFLFFGTLHSNGYIFPFLLCFWLLFFCQLFVRPPQTAILLFAFLFLGVGLVPCLLYNVMNFHPQFIRHSIRSSPLNLFLTSMVKSLGIWFRSYLNGLMAFPTFFNFSLNLAIRSSWSEPQSAPGLVFTDCIELKDYISSI